MLWQMISASLMLFLTIASFYKMPKYVIPIIGALALAANLFSIYLEKKPTNIGNFKSPLFQYSGKGVIHFGNCTINLANGGGLAVIDHRTQKPLIKIERILKNTWLFFKRDQLVVSGDFWDINSNQIVTLEDNAWKADPKVMWNSEIRDDLIKIYGSDPDREPILLCKLVSENTIMVECKSKIRDLYFSATKNGITVNGFGFTEKMTFDGKDQGIVKFMIGGPLYPISFEAEGPGFNVSGYNSKIEIERENLFAAILIANEVKVTDWKNREISMPDVPFREQALKSSVKIGKLPDSSVFIWNAILYHDKDREFYRLLKTSQWYVGETYPEAHAMHPDVMVYALECEVERQTSNGIGRVRIKMAETREDDRVINVNLPPHKYSGFKQ